MFQARTIEARKAEEEWGQPEHSGFRRIARTSAQIAVITTENWFIFNFYTKSKIFMQVKTSDEFKNLLLLLLLLLLLPAATSSSHAWPPKLHQDIP